MTRDAWKQVLDFSMVHPFTGTGTWLPNVLRDRHNAKIAKHDQAYSRQPFASYLASSPHMEPWELSSSDFSTFKRGARLRLSSLIIDLIRTTLTGILAMCFSANRARVGTAVAKVVVVVAIQL